MLYQRKCKIEAKEMREMRGEVKVNWSRGKSEFLKERCNLLVKACV